MSSFFAVKSYIFLENPSFFFVKNGRYNFCLYLCVFSAYIKGGFFRAGLFKQYVSWYTYKKISIGEIIVFKKFISLFCAVLILFSIFAVPAFAAAEDGVKLIAHRGYSGEAPENTLAAARLAGENGFDACEFDIWPTKDRVWVVMHDETVDRMTDGSGTISEMTLEEVKKLKIDAGNGLETYPNETVPTLNEMLDVCAAAGILPVIEIKNGDAENLRSLADQLEKSGLTESCTVISFVRECLTGMRALCPTLDLRLLIGKVTSDGISFCENNGINGISCNYKKNLPSAYSRLRKSGLIMTAWTVNDTENAENLVRQGFEYITTDRLVPGTVASSDNHSVADDFKTVVLRIRDAVNDIIDGIVNAVSGGCGMNG